MFQYKSKCSHTACEQESLQDWSNASNSECIIRNTQFRTTGGAPERDRGHQAQCSKTILAHWIAGMGMQEKWMRTVIY